MTTTKTPRSDGSGKKRAIAEDDQPDGSYVDVYQCMEGKKEFWDESKKANAMYQTQLLLKSGYKKDAVIPRLGVFKYDDKEDEKRANEYIGENKELYATMFGPRQVGPPPQPNDPTFCDYSRDWPKVTHFPDDMFYYLPTGIRVPLEESCACGEGLAAAFKLQIFSLGKKKLSIEDVVEAFEPYGCKVRKSLSMPRDEQEWCFVVFKIYSQMELVVITRDSRLFRCYLQAVNKGESLF